MDNQFPSVFQGTPSRLQHLRRPRSARPSPWLPGRGPRGGRRSRTSTSGGAVFFGGGPLEDPLGTWEILWEIRNPMGKCDGKSEIPWEILLEWILKGITHD